MKKKLTSREAYDHIKKELSGIDGMKIEIKRRRGIPAVYITKPQDDTTLTLILHLEKTGNETAKIDGHIKSFKSKI